METIGERIRFERERQKISRPELARAGGIAPTTLSDLELGLSKSTTALHKLAERLGVSTKWLETGKGAKSAGQADTDPDWPEIRAFADAVALGDGATVEEYAEAHKLKFRASSLRRKGLFGKPLEVYYGRGDSMEPEIRDGDAMMVDRSDTDPRDGEVFLLESEEGAVAKRLIEIGGNWFVTSDNAHDPKWRKPVPIDGKRGFRVLGRVRWVARWIG